MAKNIYIYFKFCLSYKWKCGAVVESQTGNPEIAGSSPTSAVYFSQRMACQTEYYACAVFLGGFTSYLRSGWSVNLRAIENCIFSIRSIERNLRPILRTVYRWPWRRTSESTCEHAKLCALRSHTRLTVCYMLGMAWSCQGHQYRSMFPNFVLHVKHDMIPSGSTI
jgi:hypothetical protein